jgi:hypothetical protein
MIKGELEAEAPPRDGNLRIEAVSQNGITVAAQTIQTSAHDRVKQGVLSYDFKLNLPADAPNRIAYTLTGTAACTAPPPGLTASIRIKTSSIAFNGYRTEYSQSRYPFFSLYRMTAMLIETTICPELRNERGIDAC